MTATGSRAHVTPGSQVWKGREHLCKLASSAAMQRLQKSPMQAGGQRQLIVRQPAWPATAHHAHGQVLVNNDHWVTPVSVDVVEVAGIAKQRIGIRDGVQGSLEFISQVPIDQAAQDLPVRVREARITSLPPPPPLLE